MTIPTTTATTTAKPVLYIDMDNTLVDFRSAFPLVDDETLAEYQGDEDDIPGIFALMDPWPGAIEAVYKLSERYDVYVLSTAPWANPSAWSDKVRWIQRHFGAGEESVLYKRLILSHHKNLNAGAYLVDDRPGHRGADSFGGTVLAVRVGGVPPLGSRRRPPHPLSGSRGEHHERHIDREPDDPQ